MHQKTFFWALPKQARVKKSIFHALPKLAKDKIEYFELYQYWQRVKLNILSFTNTGIAKKEKKLYLNKHCITRIFQ